MEVVRANTATAVQPVVVHAANATLEAWNPVMPAEVERLIYKVLNRTCQLDPILAWIVTRFAVQLSPFITNLCYVSLIMGRFPQIYKHAIVSPLLKKENVDLGQFRTSDPSPVCRCNRSCWRELPRSACSPSSTRQVVCRYINSHIDNGTV
jgi:hypothetical protein